MREYDIGRSFDNTGNAGWSDGSEVTMDGYTVVEDQKVRLNPVLLVPSSERGE